MVFESILNPIFSPLLTLPPVWSILIISLIITLITTLAFKYLTDQDKMKALKKELKEFQAKIKEVSKKNPDKALKMQQEMMSKNMQLMKYSFKPTLYTMIPIIIIFGWLNAHMAYDPLQPNVPFTVTLEFDQGVAGNVTFSSVPPLMISKNDTATKIIRDGRITWTLKGGTGDYTLLFEKDGEKVSKDIIISSKPGDYAPPVERFKDGGIKRITIGNKKIKPLEGWPIVGNWGWLGVYILFSIIMSFGMRKALGVT